MTAAAPWAPLEREIAQWARAGPGPPTFWWRDDDASGPGAALERLLDLSGRAGVPLALAVVPRWADPDLGPRLAARGPGLLSVLQHGVAHENRAPAGERSSEFPAGCDPGAALASIAAAHERLASLLGDLVCPVFVPPWNRIDPAVASGLTRIGFRGLSAFGRHPKAPRIEGLARLDTQADVIDWRGTRGFVGTGVAVAQLVADLAARRRGEVEPTRPTGLLTHHLVHDRAVWSFLAELIEVVSQGVRWMGAPAVLAASSDDAG